MQITKVKVEEIFPDPEFNCRGKIAPFEVTDLMKSISDTGKAVEGEGLLQPIVIQPVEGKDYKYRVVMGHRRYHACKLLGWKELPCIIRTDLDELKARAENLIENLERKDLNIIQEAKAIEKMAAITSWTEVGKFINKSYGWVQVRMTALKFPQDIQDEIAAGILNSEHIRDLYAIKNYEERYACVRRIKDARMRGDKSRILIKDIKKNVEKSVHAKRVRNQAEIFAMQDNIRENIGNNLATRALAWASAQITTQELYDDIQIATEHMGKVFKIVSEEERQVLIQDTTGET